MFSYAYITADNKCFIKPGQTPSYITGVSYGMYLVDTEEFEQWLTYNPINDKLFDYNFNAMTVKAKPFEAGFTKID